MASSYITPNYNPPVGHYDITIPKSNRGPTFNKSFDKQQIQESPKYVTHIPLASAQLSAYAKPAERTRLLRKCERDRLSRTVKFEPNMDLNISHPTRHHGKLHRYQSIKVQTEKSDEVSKVKGVGLFESVEQIHQPKQKVRRIRKAHLNIFPNNSLEQAQLQEKMKKTQMPAPGCYYRMEDQSSIRCQQIAWKYQCFSSSVKRFQEKLNNSDTAVGQYESEPIGTHKCKGISMNKQIGRRHRIDSNPGVGSYELPQMAIKSKQRDMEYPCPFGQSSKRF